MKRMRIERKKKRVERRKRKGRGFEGLLGGGPRSHRSSRTIYRTRRSENRAYKD
jgi:hypothetical protein